MNKSELAWGTTFASLGAATHSFQVMEAAVRSFIYLAFGLLVTAVCLGACNAFRRTVRTGE